MTQEVFPEIEAAAEALQSRITLTQTEIDQMKEDIKTKKALVRSWRKAVAAFNPRQATQKRPGPLSPAAFKRFRLMSGEPARCSLIPSPPFRRG